MSANVLLNLLNKLGKNDKMHGLPSILSLFGNQVNKFNNTKARIKNTLKSHFWSNKKCHKHVTNAPKGIGLA